MSERTMSVKLGTVLSSPKPVTGGAVQGSVLGVLDHNVVLNNLDDGINEEGLYVAKYVDDLMVIETVPSHINTMIDSTGNRPMHHFNPSGTQRAFDKISKKSTEKGLKIYDQKTQVLSVSSARYDTTAEIEI